MLASANEEVIKSYRSLADFSNIEIKDSRKPLISSIDSYETNDESSSATYYQAYNIPCSSIIANKPSLSAYKYLNTYNSGYNEDEYTYFDIDNPSLVSDTCCILLNDISWKDSSYKSNGLLIYACNDLNSANDYLNVPLAYYEFWKTMKSISGNMNIEWDNRGVITVI